MLTGSRRTDRAGVLRAAETPGPLERASPVHIARGSSAFPGDPTPVESAVPCKHDSVDATPPGFPPDFQAPFDNELGLVFTEITPDGAKAQLDVKPSLLQPMGIVHGGVYCSIIESLASVSAYVWLAEHGGGNVVGVNNSTDFLRAIGAGTVYAAAEPLHRGRRQQLWLVNIRDDEDRLVARGQVRLQNLEPQA